MSYSPNSREQFTRTELTSSHHPQYHFSSEVVVPAPDGFDAVGESEEEGEAADLADDSNFYKQLEEDKTPKKRENPKVIHSKLKNAQVDKDVILYHNHENQRRPKPDGDEYYDEEEAEGDPEGEDEYVEPDSGQQSGEDEYEEVENPDGEPDYEIIETQPPVPGRRPVARPRPVIPRIPVKPVKPRDPTLAVVNAARGHRSNRLTPRRRQPPIRPNNNNPCNEQISGPHHRQSKTKTITRESVIKSTKKFHSPDELYAEIAKIIDRKKKNYERPGHGNTHWELKIVPTHEDVNRN